MDRCGDTAVEAAKRRCRVLIDRVGALSKSPPSSWKTTLLCLANSELAFLNRLNPSSSSSAALSLNIGHLEAVFHILRHPSVTAVARVCKPIPISPRQNRGRGNCTVYVDVVCCFDGNPVWILVSDKNPKHNDFKELRGRILEVLIAARNSSLTVKPSSVILSFSNGLRDDVVHMVRDEFGAVEFSGFGDCSSLQHEFEEEEGDWVLVVLCRSFERACFLEIKIESFYPGMEVLDSKMELKCDSLDDLEMDKNCAANLGDSFSFLLSRMRSWSTGHVEDDAELVNFDTTALVAAVSGISNGASLKILDTPESDLRARFKGNYDFVLNQVDSEMRNPIHVDMGNVIHGRRGIVCESVITEFQEIISMCGGSREKLRAQYLLKKLKIVPDCPSARMSSLPTTRKLALKNKVAFGTGDHWRAPTMTANMAFVRAVSQTGMSLFTLEHRPRALVGD
ncbi:unnamed protein product [Cuscuta campestris]|uniref:DUF1308 domain-containing protein n=1 Tax=Cuscuta campestris TaxID=132261 RepID=A0A484KJ80_9ASTE|nr:unnamed protein product [Cuscuta campestris]